MDGGGWMGGWLFFVKFKDRSEPINSLDDSQFGSFWDPVPDITIVVAIYLATRTMVPPQRRTLCGGERTMEDRSGGK